MLIRNVVCGQLHLVCHPEIALWALAWGLVLERGKIKLRSRQNASLRRSGVQRGDSGAPPNNTWVYPAAVALPCWWEQHKLPAALGFLFHLTDFYFGTEWLRVEENGCSLPVVWRESMLESWAALVQPWNCWCDSKRFTSLQHISGALPCRDSSGREREWAELFLSKSLDMDGFIKTNIWRQLHISLVSK